MALDELLRALQRGEPGAEQHLFRQLRVELLPFFAKRVEASDVDDLTQQTLEIVALELQGFGSTGPASFRSFVFVIAHNRLMNHQKAKRRRPARTRTPLDVWWVRHEWSPEECTTMHERSTLFRAAMAAIKTRYRQALESRLRDEDPRVLAEAEGIDVGTVRTRVHRAIAMVSAEIEARRRTEREGTPT
ncbi:RNA polymerase sigma factor [Enhygromyxa salina]|uniref:RNA polymerase sigma factor RpoE n=1 Tax=Enhygromyxa salina TaxID=215803 RepID=A0A2S9XT86_9BACT|nr:RNA polymerase sigma factor [Enhygromyxa salina]PRP96054.1 RNA polymerase sigma factor RpoE [Enhygromyxa salina]